MECLSKHIFVAREEEIEIFKCTQCREVSIDPVIDANGELFGRACYLNFVAEKNEEEVEEERESVETQQLEKHSLAIKAEPQAVYPDRLRKELIMKHEVRHIICPEFSECQSRLTVEEYCYEHAQQCALEHSKGKGGRVNEARFKVCLVCDKEVPLESFSEHCQEHKCEENVLDAQIEAAHQQLEKLQFENSEKHKNLIEADNLRFFICIYCEERVDEKLESAQHHYMMHAQTFAKEEQYFEEQTIMLEEKEGTLQELKKSADLVKLQLMPTLLRCGLCEEEQAEDELPKAELKAIDTPSKNSANTMNKSEMCEHLHEHYEKEIRGPLIDLLLRENMLAELKSIGYQRIKQIFQSSKNAADRSRLILDTLEALRPYFCTACNLPLVVGSENIEEKDPLTIFQEGSLFVDSECGHRFHKDCAAAISSKACPVDKIPIKEVEINRYLLFELNVEDYKQDIKISAEEVCRINELIRSLVEICEKIASKRSDMIPRPEFTAVEGISENFLASEASIEEERKEENSSTSIFKYNSNNQTSAIYSAYPSLFSSNNPPGARQHIVHLESQQNVQPQVASQSQGTVHSPATESTAVERVRMRIIGVRDRTEEEIAESNQSAVAATSARNSNPEPITTVPTAAQEMSEETTNTGNELELERTPIRLVSIVSSRYQGTTEASAVTGNTPATTTTVATTAASGGASGAAQE